ncbi:MAG: ABC transporter substrate-binding protein, partial [Firmicutes bacterium]|nr:ABC transporter substrate-binding protein [Bacillota bacterium]
IEGDVGTLDPFLVSGNFLSVMYNYAEPLWSYDGTTEGFASDWYLAESVDAVSDTEYVIHLRKGVTFSNGSPFTAEDVIFTLNYVKYESNIAYYIPFVDVDRTYAEDDYTVRLFLNAYDKTQLAGLANITIIDKETYDPNTMGKNPIGTGPYVVTDYVVNSSLTLKARDDYWGGEVPIKNLIYKNIPEPAQKINALKTGEIDVILNCPTADVEYVESLDGINVIKKGSISQINLTYNCRKGGPLSTKEARWAVSYAVNSQGILNTALNGYGSVAKACFSASCGDFFDGIDRIHDTYKNGYNLELARKYAEESGLVGKTIILINNGTDVYVTTAQIIAQALQEIGVDAQVRNFDQATVRNMIAGEEDWDVYVSWISNPSGIGLDQVYSQVCKFGRAHAEWDTPVYNQIDELGRRLLATSDEEEYSELLVEFMTLFQDQCYMYGIADMMTINAAYDYVGGLSTEGFSTERVFDWYFK